MSLFSFGSKQGQVVWIEPHRIHTGGVSRPTGGDPTEDHLAVALNALPTGPTKWIVDDTLAPSVLMRDIVELPSGAEARETFFRWRLSQVLDTQEPLSVQATPVGDDVWLVAGVGQARRDAWVQTALRLSRPIHTLLPRWLWLYNRLAPTRDLPGMLLSLCPDGEGRYSGTLAAWGRHLLLLRQWTDPVEPETWFHERVLPTEAYLQRDGRPPQECLVWGASSWPESEVPVRILQPEIPAAEPF